MSKFWFKILTIVCTDTLNRYTVRVYKKVEKHRREGWYDEKAIINSQSVCENKSDCTANQSYF